MGRKRAEIKIEIVPGGRWDSLTPEAHNCLMYLGCDVILRCIPLSQSILGSALGEMPKPDIHPLREAEIGTSNATLVGVY